jgi:hypothetical protein
MQPPKILAYLAHPVGPGSTLEELEARRENIANTLAWLQWLVDATKWAICVPWLPYVQRLDESTYRERGIEDDLARRVWLPPLTIDQRGELKGNRAVLRAHAVDHDVIDAILAAAEVAP